MKLWKKSEFFSVTTLLIHWIGFFSLEKKYHYSTLVHEPSEPTLNSVRYTISATNGISTDSESTGEMPIEGDTMPDLIVIPPSDNLDKDEEPVISPVVTSNALLVDDIDIPVEIKSDNPIKVEIDGDGTWRDVQEI